MTANDMTRALPGLLAALVIVAAARRRRSLSRSGAVTAALLGTTVVVTAGWWSGLLLVAFFASSSALSSIGRRRRCHSASIAARGSERDAVQVLANGGVPLLLAVTMRLSHDPYLYAAYAGALAAATADTWATEIGRFSRVPPRLITTGRPIPPGTSGGVTILGTAGALLGATLIAGIAASGQVAGWAGGDDRGDRLLLAGIVAGVAGSLFDSLLGATLQVRYRCPTCELPTERRVHVCGAVTSRVGGVPFLNNDGVNAAATLIGGVVAALIVNGSW